MKYIGLFFQWHGSLAINKILVDFSANFASLTLEVRHSDKNQNHISKKSCVFHYCYVQ